MDEQREIPLVYDTAVSSNEAYEAKHHRTLGCFSLLLNFLAAFRAVRGLMTNKAL